MRGGRPPRRGETDRQKTFSASKFKGDDGKFNRNKGDSGKFKKTENDQQFTESDNHPRRNRKNFGKFKMKKRYY